MLIKLNTVTKKKKIYMMRNKKNIMRTWLNVLPLKEVTTSTSAETCL